MRGLIAVVLAACAQSPTQPEPPSAVDLVVVGARFDRSEPAQAIGITGTQIVEWAEGDAIEALVARGERVLRAPLVTPGFVDAHAHPVGLGRLDSQLILTDLPSYQATLAAVASAPGTGWIEGRGWDQNDWPDAPEGGWPLASDLDAVTGARPAALRRVDGHAVWLNSVALSTSGITAETPDPDGGRIVRDAGGNPTGVLIDEAMSLVTVPEPTAEQVAGWLKVAFDKMATAGLTGAHAMGVSDANLAVYTSLAESGELPVRIWAYVEPESQAAERLMTSGPWSVGRLSVMGVKAFADGALGSRGAWLTEPYSDEPGHAGTPIHAPIDIQTWATSLLAQDAGMAVHAIGDRAVHETIMAFAAAKRVHPDSTGVLRVEHAQLVRPEDLDPLISNGIVASVQPTHATSDMPWAEDRVGPERIRWAYRWQSLLNTQATVVFGSDFPVESHRPALGLWSATRRSDLQGQPEGGWYPNEKVSEQTALHLFTSAPAEVVGQPTVGQFTGPADLTLWAPSDSEPWTPLATIVDGVVLYDATSTAAVE